MHSYYYSNLDLINKYHFLSAISVNNVINHIEISLNKLEKEEIEGKNTDLESLMYFYSIFTRSPKLFAQKSVLFEKSSQTQKKILIYNKKHIHEVLLYLTRDCHILNETVNVIKKGNTFSLVYDVKLIYINHAPFLPANLLKRVNNDIPTIKVEILFNKNKIQYIGDIFPFWNSEHLDSLTAPSI
jgi:hypothetical protein